MLACLLTHSLTPWCRTLFEKLIVTHLVKKYPAFLWNPHNHVHKRIHYMLKKIMPDNRKSNVFCTQESHAKLCQ
jgi:hypothetical protein